MIQHFLYMKNWKYYPMLQNMMSPVLPVALTAVGKMEVLEIPVLPVSATASQAMADVFPC